MRPCARLLAAVIASPLLALGAGCAGDPDTFMDITYDPCSAVVAADGTATADEIATVEAALALWNDRGGFRLRTLGSAAGESQPLVVHFGALGAFRGYYDDEQGEISIHRGLTPAVRSIALAHEIGHAFGLFHVAASARRSVMNPGNTSVDPTPRDVEDVRALWGACEDDPQ